MLEARHLRKTYKTKGGVLTKALDDVSVTFAEKGMVFILGKSGSGKSTLLNVCGGLDKMDSGEIVIKGRSSADKGDFDFDSYRNTFVGFVFQEYNILEEFTVEENVALALELQHKKRDKEVIAKILQDVEMTEFANRKPNTLSGGQKQRVAIARALVKNPEIIMADEPTGALDSTTGKQVFDTLKKLSRDKLVLIVSHDREFAEQYGDRIIELKDGKIISDMTRAEEGETAEVKNVRFVGTDTVCVQSGAALTDQDFADIKAFLAKNKGQTVITASRNKVDTITRELRGGEFGTTEKQPEVRAYSAEEKKMIRSRLPMRHAVKMGASSLKAKPIRLTFTILLSIIAFLLFGVFSTLMLYDANEVTANAFQSSSYSYIGFAKKYYVKYENYRNGKLENSYESEYNDTAFTLEEYREWESKYPGALASISTSRSGRSFNMGNLSLDNKASAFYTNNMQQVVLDSASVQLVEGSNSAHVAADDEILISEFVYEAIKAGEFYRVKDGTISDEKVTVNSHSDVIGQYVTLGSNQGDGVPVYKIVGIFKGEATPEAYSKMEQAAQKGEEYNGQERYDWDTERSNGLYAAVAVSENNFLQFKSQNNANDGWHLVEKYFGTGCDMQLLWEYNGEPSGMNYVNSIAKYDASATDKLEIYDLRGNKLTSLSDSQAAISSYSYGTWLGKAVDLAVREEQEANPDSDIQEVFWEGKPILGADGQVQYEYGYYEYDEELGMTVWRFVNCTDAEHLKNHACPDYPNIYIEQRVKRDTSIRECFNVLNEAENIEQYNEAIGKIYTFITEYSLDIDNILTVRAENNNGNSKPVSYAGWFFTDSDYLRDCAYVGDDLFTTFRYVSNDEYQSVRITKYQENNPDAFIGMIFVPYDKSASLTDKLVALHRVRNEDDSYLKIGNSLMEGLDQVNGMVSVFSTVFMWVGIVLAAFSFLLMFNFISASIASKKKEIGILRAIGSRTLDVFKIFLAEAMIIAIICFVIATAGSFGLCILLNKIMMQESAMIVTGLLVFGPVSVLIIVGIALLVSLTATVIPVALYSRKPPVESIRAL